MDQHVELQPAGSDVGEQKAFRGICDQAVSLAGLFFVSSSLYPLFGAPVL